MTEVELRKIRIVKRGRFFNYALCEACNKVLRKSAGAMPFVFPSMPLRIAIEQKPDL